MGETGAGSITINDGEGGETGGDTLDLNGIADRTTINITNPIDVGGGISGTVQLLDGTVVNFNNIENIICFVPGALSDLTVSPQHRMLIKRIPRGAFVRAIRSIGPRPAYD